ncbi:hypothetical protein Dsin_013282 [Dipteronia sinensis]|uniref:Cyclin N-terminal domain-containing protein n=1 Tax=Dipteronia sinensis TaxID=43782 RepID=A0AAE0AKX2_9ROSI|nr:hypothetical protein Dsin_013282 [Dipteronia sinensis]
MFNRISNFNILMLISVSFPESLKIVVEHMELPNGKTTSMASNAKGTLKYKLLAEHSEVAGQEKLPSIDDVCNQLEVAEYVDDIYQYYWVMEAHPVPGNYMSIQTDITPTMRGILINWLIEVHFKFELMQETLYLMIKDLISISAELYTRDQMLGMLVVGNACPPYRG